MSNWVALLLFNLLEFCWDCLTATMLGLTILVSLRGMSILSIYSNGWLVLNDKDKTTKTKYSTVLIHYAASSSLCRITYFFPFFNSVIWLKCNLILRMEPNTYLNLKPPIKCISYPAQLWFQPILQARLMLWTYGNAHTVVEGVLCHNCREGEE